MFSFVFQRRWSRSQAGCVLLLLWLGISHGSLSAQVYDLSSKEDYRQLIVRFRPGIPIWAKENRVKPFGTISRSGDELQERQTSRNLHPANAQRDFALIELKAGQDPTRAAEALRSAPEILYVEPNSRLKLFNQPGIIPNDFDFNKLYALANGGLRGGKAGADISATRAWSIGTGSSNVVVAVIDTGVDINHEDLRGNIWQNGGEIQGNGVDDDGNGYVDDLHGYDFDSDDSFPMDDHGHGTHVSGTIGARGNNGIGIAGVCWEVRLMALKAFDNTGNGDLYSAIQAIDYAVANGARVINASWGLEDRSRALEETVSSAMDAGVLFVAAAGNDKTEVPSFPAGYPGVISVGATTFRDERALFSNHGSSVVLAAPGQDIFSTLPGNTYGFQSGTSMATPHVAGAAALVMSRSPHFTAREVKDLLVNSTDPLTTDHPLGRGRLNVERAMHHPSPLPFLEIVTTELKGNQQIIGMAGGREFGGYELFVGSSRQPRDEWRLLLAGDAPVTNSFPGKVDATLLPEGPAMLMLVGTNKAGGKATAFREVRVANVGISYPLAGDLIPHGTEVQIKGDVLGDRKFFLSVARGLKPATWQQISQITSASGILDGVLATWSTRGFPANNFYSLKLTAWSQAATNEQVISALYLDPALEHGFPQYVATGAAFPAGEWRHLRIADLDQNGLQELVFVDPPLEPGGAASLKVLRADGTPFWQAKLPVDRFTGGLPAIGDLLMRGDLQVFVEAGGALHGFTSEGVTLTGNWPLPLKGRMVSPVLADATGDGHLEIITYSQETLFNKEHGEYHLLTVYNAAGTILDEWAIPTSFNYLPEQPIFPVVADLDGDTKPEIVSVYWDNQVAAFQVGKRNPVWSSATHGMVLSSPVAGDLDGDGSLEIMVGAAAKGIYKMGGLHVFQADGRPRKGWPMLTEESFTSSPVPGDVDGDGRLEMAVTSEENYLVHLLSSDGFEMEGWPIRNDRSTMKGGLAIANITGDEKQEVIFTSPGYLSLAMLDNDPGYVGGVKGWSADGAPVDFGKGPAQASLYYEGSSRPEYHKASAATVIDLKGDGRLKLVAMSIQERLFGTRAGDGARTKNRSGIYVWDLQKQAVESEASWPMSHQNIRNNAVHPPHRGQVPQQPTRNDRAITMEDRAVTIDVLKNDFPVLVPNARVGSLQQPLNGVVTISSSKQLIYTPKTNYHGSDRFQYKSVADGVESDWIQVEVMIKPVNDIPYFPPQHFTLNRNSHVDITFNGSDAESSNLTYKIVTAPAHGELWVYPTVANYYPHKGYSGLDYIGVVANDGTADSKVSYIQLNILPKNNSPKAQAQYLVVKRNSTIELQLKATDEDQDEVTFRISKPPGNGLLTPQGGDSSRYSYTPGAEARDKDTEHFTFEAFDGQSWSGPATVQLTITGENKEPIAHDGEYRTSANQKVRIRPRGSDGENDRLTFQVIQEPLHGLLEQEGEGWNYTPSLGFSGADRVVFQAFDGELKSAPAEITINVASTNKPPQAVNQSFEVPANTAIEIKLQAEDQDGQRTEAILLQGPAHGRLYGTGVQFTYLPDDGYRGADQFTYLPWDGEDYGEMAVAYLLIGPKAPQELPYIERLEAIGGTIRIWLQLEAGKSYLIQRSVNLDDWETVSERLTSSEGGMTWETVQQNGQAEFFRIVEVLDAR